MLSKFNSFWKKLIEFFKTVNTIRSFIQTIKIATKFLLSVLPFILAWCDNNLN